MKSKITFFALSTALFFSMFNQSVSESGDIDDLSNKNSSESIHLEIVEAEEVPEGVSSINFDSYEDFENAVRAWEVDQLNREKEEDFFVTNPPYVNDYDVNTLSIHTRQDCQQRLYSLYC